ncbi:hypothetical protein [Clostridium sp. JS66]|uniref:hypothetical protein n=1 Tax=Clostridium sp. JS66 TaxID=3064705 RepID=UPI00298DF6E6|nr:hypothetical protein [Clostridium sp. JS66]WPC41634.1 hypothetical protein Q6H37_27840 [Clostridium sp. JS66]
MAEIKLNEQAFDNTVSKLSSYEKSLNTTNNNFKQVNSKMKENWIGDGGTAFICAANVVETKFLQMIQDLQEESNDLGTAKLSMFGLDSNLASGIAGAISGPIAAGVAAVSAAAKHAK